MIQQTRVVLVIRVDAEFVENVFQRSGIQGPDHRFGIAFGQDFSRTHESDSVGFKSLLE